MLSKDQQHPHTRRTLPYAGQTSTWTGCMDEHKRPKTNDPCRLSDHDLVGDDTKPTPAFQLSPPLGVIDWHDEPQDPDYEQSVHFDAVDLEDTTDEDFTQRMTATSTETVPSMMARWCMESLDNELDYVRLGGPLFDPANPLQRPHDRAAKGQMQADIEELYYQEWLRQNGRPDQVNERLIEQVAFEQKLHEYETSDAIGTQAWMKVGPREGGQGMSNVQS